MRRRVACVALSEIRLETAKDTGGEALGSAPLALVIARPGGKVKTERELVGGTRIDVVSRDARRLGVRVGSTIAAAKARCASLRVRVVAEEAVFAALARVAEVAMAFGPAVSFDAARDLVWIEIGGCAAIHGSENDLGLELARRVRALGHECRIAIAEGPRIAAALARFGRADPVHVVEEGEGAAAMRAIPIAALELGDDTLAWLTDLGLRTCGDLQKLPRAALGTRLGDRTFDVMPWLEGEDRAPLDVWRPEPVPEERIELEWGVSSLDALAFVLKKLCDRLASRLEGRAMRSSRLELVLDLDRGPCSPRAGEGSNAAARTTVDVSLSSSMLRAADWLALLRVRLENETLAAPVRALALRALSLAPVASCTIDMFVQPPRAARALPRLVAELVAELAPSDVGTLELADTWVPDERTRLVPFAIVAPPGNVERSGSALVNAALEPSRLVPAFPVGYETLREVRLLARLEGSEWWRRGILRRDMAAAWLTSTGRNDGAASAVQALAWVEVTKLRSTHARGTDGCGTEQSSAARPAAPRVSTAIAQISTAIAQRQAMIRGWID